MPRYLSQFLSAEQFYGALSEKFGRAPITVRKRLNQDPYKEVIENGRCKHYFTQDQLMKAIVRLELDAPFVGQGNYKHKRRKA